MTVGREKRKRKISDTESVTKHEPAIKKQVLEQNEPEKETQENSVVFSGKEFRNHLKTPYAVNSVNKFITLCEGNPEAGKYVFQYLKAGGNCLELIHLLDFTEKSNIAYATPVFQALNVILLKITSDFTQHVNSSEEACRYLLNNYLITIHAMLNNNATINQRRIVLKLLTAMVTLSSAMAKEVLNQITFQKQTLSLLSRHIGRTGSTVRTCFIHLLIAFLVDGNPSTVKSLIEKKGVLTSIIPELSSDNAQTISLVLNSLRTHVLENPALTKTSKMHVFNTQVVKDIVRLYNWKGPQFELNKKQASQEDITKVHLVVHEFLLVLCTSHKNGVIFRDKTLGLGHQKHNPLLYTVIDSFSNPWDNKYVSEFVIKIAVACPDLVKVILSKIGSIEPRLSKKWFKTMTFLKTLFTALTPDIIKSSAGELTVQQLITVIETFTVPSVVLQLFKKECIANENIYIRYVGMDLLLCMLKSLTNYTEAVVKWNVLTGNDANVLKASIGDYIFKNISSQNILKAWMLGFEDGVENEDVEDADVFADLDVNNIYVFILDVLFYYQNLCPQILDNLSFDFNKMVQNIASIQLEESICNALFLKIVRMYVQIDRASFSPDQVHFEGVLLKLLKVFRCEDDNQKDSLELLTKIFVDTGIFEETENEIITWLEPLKRSRNVDATLIDSIKRAYVDKAAYLDKLSEIKNISSASGYEIENVDLIFENLEIGSNNKSNRLNRVKHVLFSPLILSVLDRMSENHNDSYGDYITDVAVPLLHSQTCPSVLLHSLLQKEYENIFPPPLLKYLKSWQTTEKPTSLKKIYGQTIVGRLSKSLISSETAVDVEGIFGEIPAGFNVVREGTEMLKMTLFYLTQFASKQILTEVQKNNCRIILIHLSELIKKESESSSTDGIKLILSHPVVHQFFVPLCRKKNSTEKLISDFVVEIIACLKDMKATGDIDAFFIPFREKLVARILLTSKKNKFKSYASNSDDFLSLLKTFELDGEQCDEILRCLVEQTEENSLIVCDSVSFLLRQYTLKSVRALDEQLFKKIVELNISYESLSVYLEKYPHCIVNTGEMIFEKILNENDTAKAAARLAKFLIDRRPKLKELFVENFENILLKKDLLFTLLNGTELGDSAKQKLHSAVFEKYQATIIKAIEKPHKTRNSIRDNYSVLSELIDSHLSIDYCKKFANKVNKFEIIDIFHLNVIERVFLKCFSQENDAKYVTNYIETLLQMINYGHKKNLIDSRITDRIKALIIDALQKHNVHKLNVTVWNNFVQTVLKHSLKVTENNSLNCNLLDVLLRLCPIVYPQDSDDEGVLADVAFVHEMTFSHSEFLNVMLGKSEIKTRILKLIIVLSRTNKSVVSEKHVPLFLSAYNATSNVDDRLILNLLWFYESCGVSLSNYKPYLWGEFAANYYSVKGNVEMSLWRQPTASQVLELLDNEIVLNTVANFDFSRKDVSINDANFSEKDIVSFEERGDNVERTKGTSNKNVRSFYSPRNKAIPTYDPCFYLPLFCHLLSPESVVKCYKFTQSGGLALTLLGLASECSVIRGAAHCVLSRFYFHLEDRSGSKDKKIWIQLIDSIRRGLVAYADDKNEPNVRVPCISVVFLARATIIMTQPLNPLYTPINNFLILKNTFDFSTIPELLQLFHCSDVDYKTYRNWILQVLRDGLKTELDLALMFKSVAYKFIGDFCLSTLCDFNSKLLILQIFRLSLDKATNFLVNSFGLLSWLNGFICNLTTEHDLIVEIIKIFSDLTQRFDDKKHERDDSVDPNILNIKSMSKLLTKLLYKLPKNLDSDNYFLFTQTFYNVFKNGYVNISRDCVEYLIEYSSQIIGDDNCKYVLEHGNLIIENLILTDSVHSETDTKVQLTQKYLKRIVISWIEKNKNDY